jgi:hypothetical protein
MQSISADARGAHVARRSCVERLLRAIGYPDRAPEAALSFTLLVDGVEIVASEEDGRLRLVCRLTDDAAHLPRLAEYAAGRMLREDAVLAFDQRSGAAILWREVDGSADERTLQRAFEDFADSCDWWRERIAAQSGDQEAPAFPEMMIRP